MNIAFKDPDYPKLPRKWKSLSTQERSEVYLRRARWRREKHPKMYRKVAKRVLTLRKSLGLTQNQFARQMGVFWRTVIRWEKAEGYYPSRLTLRRLKELEELNSALVKQNRKGDFH